MHILVTGGAGFIGSHVCEKLLARGDTVTSFDNFNDYYDTRRKEKNHSLLEASPNYTLVRGDIREKAVLDRLFSQQKFDKIIHLAAQAGVRFSEQYPELCEEVNVKGMLHVLEAARKAGIKHVVFASSSSVYGGITQLPFVETQQTDKPVSVYGWTKQAGELLCRKYCMKNNMDINCLRLFTVYGSRGRPDMAPFLFTKHISEGIPLQMFGDGSSERDYTYVTGVVNGFLSALDHRSGFETFNIGNDTPVKLHTFISLIEKCLEKKAIIEQVPLPGSDVPKTCADISKARDILGYHPEVKIEEGISHFVEWYKKAYPTVSCEVKS